MANEAPLSQRVDQWLWFARIAKTRTLAQALIERGKVRLNRERLYKASACVRQGDVLTVSTGPRVRVIEVSAVGWRRGPASEAVLLYKELTQIQPRENQERTPAPAITGLRPSGTGRPTKRERRQTDRLKDR